MEEVRGKGTKNQHDKSAGISTVRAGGIERKSERNLRTREGTLNSMRLLRLALVRTGTMEVFEPV